MATTPCPFCAADVRIPKGDEGTCPACGEALRFIDAPELACQRCGKKNPYSPHRETVRCTCGHWQAVDGRRVVFEAICPRCKRSIEAPERAAEHTCPHCAATMTLQDTL